MAVKGPFEKPVHYIGLSSDTKPTVDVRGGSTFFETDTTNEYIYDGTSWTQL